MELNYETVVGMEHQRGEYQGKKYELINLYLACRCSSGGNIVDSYGSRCRTVKIYAKTYNDQVNPVFVEAQNLKEKDSIFCVYDDKKNLIGFMKKEK